METQINKSVLQSVQCIKDKNLYVYKTDSNPFFLEEEYTLINCFPLQPNGDVDFSKEIGIYGKDLISADCAKSDIPS